MRTLHLIVLGLMLCGWLACSARGETFQLNDGKSVSGDIVNGSANDAGVQIRTGEGAYQRIPWTDFSQAELKKFAEDKKLEPLVSPYIEETPEQRIQKTEVEIRPVPRLHRPQIHSLLGALLSSSVGLFLLFLVYAATLYAAYEVSIFRAQPPALVCGLAAIPLLGVLSPIIFLSLPTRLKTRPEDEVPAEVAAAATQSFSVPDATSAPHPAAGAAPSAEAPAGGNEGGLRLAHAEAAAPAGASLPPPQIFQRGAFTFNRRFFETKFPGFFGIARRDADKDMVLAVKSARGEFVAQRITRITSNEVHLQVQKGNATEEVMVPFTEIQEIRLKHKDA